MADASFGKYRLLAELGHGGMADVFLAVVAGPAGSGFSKLTVIKRLRQNLAEDPEFVAMLVDEARIAARLNHPNVVQTNEVGQVASQYFIAMEYLDGQPLHRVQFRVAKETTPTVTQAMQYLVIVDALAGLHHAHDLSDYDGTSLQIVHRDVTPHNIFITYDGQVKVVDFGIAKAVGRASETRQGVVKGKVRYMAPEQAIGQSLDRRADVFSMGIILWEVVTGRRMWKDRDDLQIVQSLVSGEVPKSPRSVNPDVPEGLDNICKKALAFRPEDRYGSADEFRTDLEQYLTDAGLLIEARRKLGAAVGELFKDKRAEIKQVIERQLSELTKISSGEFRPAFIALESSSSPTPTAANKAVTVSLEHETKSALTDQAPTELYQRKQRSRARLALPPVLIGVALLIAVGIGWSATRKANGHGIAIDGTANASTSVSPSATPAPEETEVSIKVEPVNASVKLDGRELGSVLESRLPRDHKEHRIDVSADGFISKSDTVLFDGSRVERHIRLEKSGGQGSASPIVKAEVKQPTSNPWVRTPAPPPPRAPNGAAVPTTPPTATPTTQEPPSTTPASTGSSRRKREIDKTDPWGNPTN